MRYEEYTAESFSQCVKDLMKKNHVVAKKMCAELKIPYATFAKWMGSNAMPSVSSVLMIADYFRVEPHALFGKGSISQQEILAELKSVKDQNSSLLNDLGSFSFLNLISLAIFENYHKY